jgi:UDP-N-acetylmuramoyl-tripeptide--D-alanyl-D-alanine ligase
MTTNGSNIIWTSTEAAAATKGTAAGSWQATGVSIDSRTVSRGDLFIAIRGEKSDGHAYVADALDKGAVCAVVDQAVPGVDPARLLIVADTFRAMEDLGRAARARTGAKIIGITGSVGKTGTKEMLAAAFSSYAQTHASAKSYNNHWGVPLSLSQMHAGTDIGIFEMGMNHAGEITPLTGMVRPDIAIITTIAAVHAGNFDNGVEGIAQAKAEIFDGMIAGGAAILPRDNEWYDLLKARAEEKGVRALSFGEHESADARLTDCLLAANGTRVNAVILGQPCAFTLQMAGKHLAMNALAVLLAVAVAGGDVGKAASALNRLEPLAGRGKREELDIGDKNNPVVLIDESYNASPESMKAAFRVLALIDPGRGGRRIAVLGDMYEQGVNAARIHEELAMPLMAANVQLVYTSGPLMKNLYNALPENKRGAHIDDSAELAKIVPDVLVPGDVVMVKGSRGGGEKPRMQLVVEALRALPAKMKGKTHAV